MDSRIAVLLGLGVLATPAMADPQFSADFSASTGYLEVDGYQYGLSDIDGRINAAFHDTWNVSLEAGLTGPVDLYEEHQSLTAIGHAWYRGDHFAAGAFGGIMRSGQYAEDYALFGAEAEVYFGNHFVLGAQYVRSSYQSDECCGVDYDTVRVWLDHYIGPDTRVGVGAAWLTDEYDNKMPVITAIGETRLWSSPFGVFVKLSHTSDLPSDYGDSVTTGLVGIRIYADAVGTTLWDHNRALPWDVLRTDPSINYWSCFVGTTRVLMADGTTKKIADVRVGEAVVGEGGTVNTVVEVETPPLGTRLLYGFNGGPAFVTAEHPFRGRDGWQSINPDLTAEEVPGLEVRPLTQGQEVAVLTAVNARELHVASAVGAFVAPSQFDVEVETAFKTLDTITPQAGNPLMTVYNLRLDGNHTYFADGYLVHNK